MSSMLSGGSIWWKALMPIMSLGGITAEKSLFSDSKEMNNFLALSDTLTIDKYMHGYQMQMVDLLRTLITS